MDQSLSAILFLIVSNLLFFFALFLIIHVLAKNKKSGIHHLVSGKRSRIEQHLVFEAISGCAYLPDVRSTVSSVCDRAAELFGLSDWYVFLRNDEESLALFASSRQLRLSETPVLEPVISKWALNNPEPAEFGNFLVAAVHTSDIRKALSNSKRNTMIPLLEGTDYFGYILLYGNPKSHTRPSDQFKNLFAATASLLIKKKIVDEQEKKMRQEKDHNANLVRLGQLAAGLAHEIRNPMALIKSATQYLRSQYRYNEKDQSLSQSVVDQIDRINRHIEDLLLMGRIDPAEFSTINLNQILIKAEMLARSKAEEKNIEIQLSLTSADLLVSSSEFLLWQLVNNLVINGLDAIESGGTLTLKSQQVEENAVVSVIDTGTGISLDHLDHIFDPFYTTKETGTGLGLTIAHSIVKAHKGKLRVIPENRKGTHMQFTIPCAEEKSGLS